MSEIRYWNAISPGNDPQSQQTRKAREAVEKFDDSFRNQLFSELSQLGGDALMSGADSNALSGLLGDGGPKLMNLDVPGIEKVWAAQLSSPITSFGGMDSSSKTDSSGLSGMIDLMMKEQLARARKNITKDSGQYSFDDFVKDLGGNDDSIESIQQSGDNSIPATMEAFIASIQQQIKQAATQYNVSENEIRRRVSSDTAVANEKKR